MAPHDLPRACDLRPRLAAWGLPARRQGARPTCSVFVVAAALEYALAAQQEHGTRLSVEFLNWAAHRAADRAADGGFFSELWAGYDAYGICPEAVLPYREAYEPDLEPPEAAVAAAGAMREPGLRFHWIKGWDPNTGLTDAQFDSIRRTLAAGWPVCAGCRWPREPRWEAGMLQLCPPQAVYDGHSVLLAGYRDDPDLPGGGFLIRNTAGDARDGAMPYEYARRYVNDAAWVGGGP